MNRDRNSLTQPLRTNAVRYPRQKRSQGRFDLILASAERLLETMEPEDVSIYTIAEESGLSAPSIYHFFSDANQVFITLAERILERFVSVFDLQLPASIETWQQLFALRFGEGRDHYNLNGPARRLLLGSGLSAAIRARDLEVDRQIAVRSIAEMKQYFVMPDMPELVDRFTELLVINDAIWALSVHRHGTITDAYEEQARRAREAYCKTFLPEYLPARQPNQAAA